MHLVRLAPALFGAALLLSGTLHGQATAATKTTTRTYDCTKPDNATKTVCKNAAAAATAATAKPAPAEATVTKTTVARNYDCSKPGNASKAVCKKATTPAAPVAAAPPTPAAPPVAASATRTTAVHTQTTSKTTTSGDASVHALGPNGATAQCNDGTYSKSTRRSGTCAGHKGVQTWY